jgi:GT2 family glycosyltransferase
MGKGGLVGVVTVTFNSAAIIREFMDSVLRQTHTEFTLFVVDNASTDDTLKLVSTYQDSRIILIQNEINVGVAEGNNDGIRAALKKGCSHVLLINNDTVFDSGLLSQLLAGIEQYQCDMVVPKILYFDEPKRIWCAGGSLSRLRASARHFGLNENDDGRFDHAHEVSYSPTCCMLIRREVFERIGLMDATYFVYFDDTDFCLRAHRAGIKLSYLPCARLFHKVSSLTVSESEFTVRHLIRNHVYYLLKNFPRWQIAFYLPAFQAKILLRYLLTPAKLRAFVTAQKAFVEGISLFWSRAKGIHATISPTDLR